MSIKTMTFVATVALWPLAGLAQHDHAAGGAAEHGAQAEATPPAAHGSMHKHMQAMREQMARIHTTDDPAERERLMQEHMRSMEAHMRTMMANAPQAGGQDAAATRCADADMPCRMRELENREEMRARSMASMQERMTEMQEMMGQMMEHLRAQESPGNGARRERSR